MKKKLILLGSIAFFVLSSFASYVLSFETRENGFTRNFAAIRYRAAAVSELAPGRYYFADAGNDVLFLRQSGNRDHIYRVDTGLTYIHEIKLGIGDSLRSQNSFLGICMYDTLVLVHGQGSGTFTRVSPSVRETYTYKKPGVWFDQPALFSEQDVFCREISLVGEQLSMRLLKLGYRTSEVRDTLVLATGRQEVFAKDGTLSYDKTSGRLYYLYFRTGQIVCRDTAFRTVYISPTIDGAVNTRNGREPQLLNRGYRANGKELYVFSMRRADNESLLPFLGRQNIDVYNAEDGSYRYSFYLPAYKREKMTDIYIKRGTVFALFGPYLVKFSPLTNRAGK